jgi:hypothetical protein
MRGKTITSFFITISDAVGLCKQGVLLAQGCLLAQGFLLAQGCFSLSRQISGEVHNMEYTALLLGA